MANKDQKKSGMMLRTAIMACLVGTVASWTAFADQNALPTIAGTNLK
jgi:hypothetical protein